MSDEYRESPVEGRAGWTRITDGGNTRFRHESSGMEVSNRQFNNLKMKYPGNQFIPEESIRAVAMAVPSVTPQPVNAPQPPKDDFTTVDEEFTQPKIPSTVKPTPGVSRASASRAAAGPHHTLNRGQYKGFMNNQTKVDPKQEPMSIADISTDVKPHQRPRSVRHPKPTAKTLGEGFKHLLLLITAGIVARLLQDGRAAMTEQEASVLGMALGNLLEHTKLNESYGWVIAETGDWQAVGYILIVYLGRVNDIVQEKKTKASLSPTAGPVNMPSAPPPSDSNGHQHMQTGSHGQEIVVPYRPIAGSGPRDLRNLGGPPPTQ